MENLHQLKSLCMMDNKLSRIPDQIGQIKNLNYLNLSANFLKFLPSALKNLSNLTNLIVDGNALTRFPPCLRYLTNLETLSCMENKITEIPEWIELMINLKVLKLNSNLIAGIPDGLCRLAELEKLKQVRLHGNRLEFVPMTFLTTGFINMSFKNNPWMQESSVPSKEKLCTLKEIASRKVLKSGMSFKDLPRVIIEYLNSYLRCDALRCPRAEIYLEDPVIFLFQEYQFPIKARFCSFSCYLDFINGEEIGGIQGFLSDLGEDFEYESDNEEEDVLVAIPIGGNDSDPEDSDED